ncbi:hypothetical protein EDEG_01305 [Edhazardia aedis USNM 41457]|uniref:Uncharacterized protein n=1 Tax=Edhazardia aedis (strain USNM 41457) TaxID=1003232 RepID=J9DPG3_EDHAE|nr:hypothetical protein EDEG_01305 [Edhazardia aedis USNM 41457]|eukprot:EJW04435.1 hypothetical protein EDEG_01305 [Edhazardia aedis USNM 41457]
MFDAGREIFSNIIKQKIITNPSYRKIYFNRCYSLVEFLDILFFYLYHTYTQYHYNKNSIFFIWIFTLKYFFIIIVILLFFFVSMHEFLYIFQYRTITSNIITKET